MVHSKQGFSKNNIRLHTLKLLYLSAYSAYSHMSQTYTYLIPTSDNVNSSRTSTLAYESISASASSFFLFAPFLSMFTCCNFLYYILCSDLFLSDSLLLQRPSFPTGIIKFSSNLVFPKTTNDNRMLLVWLLDAMLT